MLEQSRSQMLGLDGCLSKADHKADHNVQVSDRGVYFVPAHSGQSWPETTERFAGMAQDGHDLAMCGWPLEVRGLANKSEGSGQ